MVILLGCRNQQHQAWDEYDRYNKDEKHCLNAVKAKMNLFWVKLEKDRGEEALDSSDSMELKSQTLDFSSSI